MVLPNLVFDVLLFGALALAGLFDTLVPASVGVVGFLAVAGALYIASQEWCEALGRRKLLAPESLATSLATTTAGFVYFGLQRNPSDFALLLLSIGLMMTALMVAIAIISTLGAMVNEKSFKPLGGLLLTAGGSLALGIAGGILTLDSRLLLAVTIVGFVAWKVVEAVTRRPEAPLAAPALDATHDERSAWERPVEPIAPSASNPPLPAATTIQRMVSPQRGTLLNRLLPTLLLGLLGFLIWHAALPGHAGMQSPASAQNR